ncbi:hypothetical protein N657DRAFT_51120 [Parathielavia appendiculata]|uniref:Uncharacterized protein n=1 Tax=Parathielavia appendiculata TaxID=2587402 RepID=A0AAN6Z9B4_9PEZI|nr:hypothetical protein N657DRAFT_51120 [Parathielavia appendiculata]
MRCGFKTLRHLTVGDTVWCGPGLPIVRLRWDKWGLARDGGDNVLVALNSSPFSSTQKHWLPAFSSSSALCTEKAGRTHACLSAIACRMMICPDKGTSRHVLLSRPEKSALRDTDSFGRWRTRWRADRHVMAFSAQESGCWDSVIAVSPIQNCFLDTRPTPGIPNGRADVFQGFQEFGLARRQAVAGGVPRFFHVRFVDRRWPAISASILTVGKWNRKNCKGEMEVWARWSPIKFGCRHR